MDQSYVEQVDGGYWVKGTGVSLDSIVFAFNRGAAPESIRRSYPVLTLEEVYGAIAYYLGHAQTIDRYLRQSEEVFEAEVNERRAKARAAKPELFDKLDKARQERQITRK